MLTSIQDIGTMNVCKLQMRNCEVKYPAQGYTAHEWWSHSSDPGN